MYYLNQRPRQKLNGSEHEWDPDPHDTPVIPDNTAVESVVVLHILHLQNPQVNLHKYEKLEGIEK